MKVFRMHDKYKDWLDLHSHTLIAFQPVFEKREGYFREGLVVSELSWDYKYKPYVKHYLSYRFISRLTHNCGPVLLTPDTVNIVSDNFDGISDISAYLKEADAYLKDFADKFEMELLKGTPFPEPQEIDCWSPYYCTVTITHTLNSIKI